LICVNVLGRVGPTIDRMKRLMAMLRRRCAVLPNPPDADALAAVHRCDRCAYTKLCDDLLASPGNGGQRSFCPNAGYIEQLRERGLKF
jgi:hypothetical protein